MSTLVTQRFSGLYGAKGWIAIAIFSAIALVLIPLLNLAVPPSSAFHLSDYTVGLLGKFMCYAMVALAMDLIWGYTGILSLGHGVFFALGGYAMGMYLMRMIGTEGNYGSLLQTSWCSWIGRRCPGIGTARITFGTRYYWWC